MLTNRNTASERSLPRVLICLAVAGTLGSPACVLAEPLDGDRRGLSQSASSATTGRAIDTPRARKWIQIDPHQEVRAYELAPRTSKDDERVEAFLQRHPSISDRQSKE